ncbi:MAG TPA: hypothetical protein VKV26_03050 [Dehalococcoidia bacterium]|nr:hypothetical protein [Dehalococcoidia bacterium]
MDGIARLAALGRGEAEAERGIVDVGGVEQEHLLAAVRACTEQQGVRGRDSIGKRCAASLSIVAAVVRLARMRPTEQADSDVDVPPEPLPTRPAMLFTSAKAPISTRIATPMRSGSRSNA